MCFFQIVLEMKNLPQTLQVSAILFWWVVKCLASLYLSVNTASHKSHANPVPRYKKCVKKNYGPMDGIVRTLDVQCANDKSFLL